MLGDAYLCFQELSPLTTKFIFVQCFCFHHTWHPDEILQRQPPRWEKVVDHDLNYKKVVILRNHNDQKIPKTILVRVQYYL